MPSCEPCLFFVSLRNSGSCSFAVRSQGIPGSLCAPWPCRPALPPPTAPHALSTTLACTSASRASGSCRTHTTPTAHFLDIQSIVSATIQIGQVNTIRIHKKPYAKPKPASESTNNDRLGNSASTTTKKCNIAPMAIYTNSKRSETLCVTSQPYSFHLSWSPIVGQRIGENKYRRRHWVEWPVRGLCNFWSQHQYIDVMVCLMTRVFRLTRRRSGTCPPIDGTISEGCKEGETLWLQISEGSREDTRYSKIAAFLRAFV